MFSSDLILGKYHLLPPGGLLEFGGAHNFWRQKGGNTIFFSPNRGGTEDFHKKNSDFCISRLLKSAQNSSSWTSGLS